MKISKIGALCKAQKRFTLCTIRGEQWLSDGYGVYPLGDLPRLDGENIFIIFDVPGDKREKFYFNEKYGEFESLDFSDKTADEKLLKISPAWLVVSGAVLLPLISEGRVLLVDKKYFAPFDHAVELYERKTADGSSYVVAKQGMITCGLILPTTFGDAALANQLFEIGELMAGCFTPSDEPSQMSFDDEEEDE